MKNHNYDSEPVAVMKLDRLTMGENLRRLREDNHMSAMDLSERMDLTSSMLYKIEEGQRTLSTEQVFNLMNIFGVDANTILLVGPTQGGIENG